MTFQQSCGKSRLIKEKNENPGKIKCQIQTLKQKTSCPNLAKQQDQTTMSVRKELDKEELL